MKEARLREIIREELELHEPLPVTYTAAEAAKYLHVSTATLASKRCVGGGPDFHKDQGMIIYTEKNLKEYLARTKKRGE